MAAKSRTRSSSKGSSRGRDASSGRAQPKKSSSPGGGRGTSAAAGAKGSRAARTPGLDEKAVGRLVARASAAMPRARVRSAFSGTTPLSPNMITVLGSLPAVAVVGISVALHQPVLLVVALAVMAAGMFLLMRVVNSMCVVAELPTELVVFTNRSSGLEPRSRGPLQVGLLPSRDRRWLHVEVAGERLWVSRRAFGAIVDRLTDREEPAA